MILKLVTFINDFELGVFMDLKEQIETAYTENIYGKSKYT